jgi:hypothetical protein
MEERFGFTLNQINATGVVDVRDRARRSIQSGGDDFDMAMLTPINALNLAREGLLEMIDMIPNINLSRPWWDQDMNRDFSIGGRLFFTSGDFSFNQYSATIPIFFNKQLHADLDLDCPYELVNSGGWTVEKFGEQAREALADLDGNGRFDRNDQWGYMAFSHARVHERAGRKIYPERRA